MFGLEALIPKTRWDFSAGENEGDERNRQKYKETKKEERQCNHIVTMWFKHSQDELIFYIGNNLLQSYLRP